MGNLSKIVLRQILESEAKNLDFKRNKSKHFTFVFIMLDFWLMLFPIKLYSCKNIFIKQLVFTLFQGKTSDYLSPPEEFLLNKRPELICNADIKIRIC